MLGEAARFVEEVLRVNERYLVEVVEAFELCPFARGARLSGSLRRRVIAESRPAAQAVAAEVAPLVADLACEVALLILPRLVVSAPAFDRFVSEVREAEPSRAFAMAGFHPGGEWSTATPSRMVMFFRRTPDPTIQLVRMSALDAVKRGEPPSGKFLFAVHAHVLAELERRAETLTLSQRIARDNHARALAEGLARFEAVFADIGADRDRAYGG